MERNSRSEGADARPIDHEYIAPDVISVLDEAFASLEPTREELIRAAALRRPLKNHLRPALLPYPDEVKLFNTPSPPRFTGDVPSDCELVKIAYMAARNVRFPGSRASGRFTRGIVGETKQAVLSMRTAGLDQPHLWAMFRLSWSKVSRPLKTVFSAEAFLNPRIMEHYEYSAQRMGNRSYMAPSHLKLLKLWHEAERAVLHSDAETLEQAEAIARVILPRVQLSRLLREGNEEKRALVASLRERVRLGKWIWNTIGGVRG